MFKIVIADGNHQLPDDDIYYLVGKEGIFIKKKLGIMESLSKVDNISILESVKTQAKMHIPKMPSYMTAKISNFFRQVYKDVGRSECIVLLFYNEETKKFKIVPPDQKVGPGSLDYTRNITIPGYVMVGSVHSHGGMSAFHSGVDDKDEESFDGLHITFGNMNDDFISISASIVSNGQRTMVNAEDYLNGIKLEKEVNEEKKVPTIRTYKWDPVKKKTVEVTSSYVSKSYKTVRRFDRRYKILSEESTKAQVSKSWMDKVELKSYSYGYAGAGAWRGYYQNGRWVPHTTNRGWGHNFDSSIWGQNKKTTEIKKPPQNVGPSSTTKPIEFPKHTDGVVTVQSNEKRPACETCAFRDRAFDYVAEELAKRNGSIDDFDLEYEVYQCEKCKTIISSKLEDEAKYESYEIICPECQTDEFLLDVTADFYDFDTQYDDDEYDAWLREHTVTRSNNEISCLTCSTRMDPSMLIEGKYGGECPTCGTLLIPNQNLNYTKENEGALKCKNCNSEFTYDLAKNSGNCCPFCKTPLIELSKDLLGEGSCEVESAAQEEVEKYQKDKDQPNPSNIITPDLQIETTKKNALQRLADRFMGRRK